MWLFVKYLVIVNLKTLVSSENVQWIQHLYRNTKIGLEFPGNLIYVHVNQ